MMFASTMISTQRSATSAPPDVLVVDGLVWSGEIVSARDPGITVKYDVLGEKRGESGIISSSSTDERNYRVTVTNQHPRPIEVLVIDQMPVSLNEDITVELAGPNAPDEKNFEVGPNSPIEALQKLNKDN